MMMARAASSLHVRALKEPHSTSPADETHMGNLQVVTFLHRVNFALPTVSPNMSELKDTSNGTADTNGTSSKPSTPHSKSGWDGKLRVNKQATLANPEALSDPDYSDEDAPPVDQIAADEGMPYHA